MCSPQYRSVQYTPSYKQQLPRCSNAHQHCICLKHVASVLHPGHHQKKSALAPFHDHGHQQATCVCHASILYLMKKIERKDCSIHTGAWQSWDRCEDLGRPLSMMLRSGHNKQVASLDMFSLRIPWPGHSRLLHELLDLRILFRQVIIAAVQ